MAVLLKGKTDPEVQTGRKIVENYLATKGCTEFEWNGGVFRKRKYAITFTCQGSHYRIQIGHVTLTGLGNDPHKDQKLLALWKDRFKVDL